MDGTKEITLSQIIQMVLKYKIWVFLSCVLGVLAAFAVTSFFMDNRYESSVKLYVYTPLSFEQPSMSQELSEISYAQRVIPT